MRSRVSFLLLAFSSAAVSFCISCSREPAEPPIEAPPAVADAHTAGWTVRDILAVAFNGGAIGVAAPSLESVHGLVERCAAARTIQGISALTGMEFTANKFTEMIAGEIGLPGVRTFADLLAQTGLDGNRTVGLMVFPENGGEALALLPVASADRLGEALKFANSAPIEVTINGEKCAGAHERGKAAYVLYRDYAVLADSLETLERGAAAFANPAPIRYGTPEFPAPDNEVVVGMSPGAWTDASGNIRDSIADPEIAPFLKQAAALFDEVVFAVGAAGSGGRERLAAHTRAPFQAETLQPLKLPGMLPADALAIAALRLSPGLRGFLREAAVASAPDSHEAQMASGFFTMLDGVLGEEAACAVLDFDFVSGPIGVLIAQSPSPKAIEGLASMSGASVAMPPYKGCQVFGASDVPGLGIDLFWASTDQLFLLATRKDALQGVIDRVTTEVPAADGFVPDTVRFAHANHGFLWLNAAKLQDVLSLVLPAGTAAQGLAKTGDVSMSLEQHETWQQVVLESPDTPLVAGLFGGLFLLAGQSSVVSPFVYML